MIRVVILLFVLAAVRPGVALGQELTIALSTPEIRITSSFTGADVTLFGVIAEDPDPPEGGYVVTVTLRGPTQNVAVRRKDRVAGVWINRASETVVAVPSFHALRTSHERDEIGDTGFQRRNLIGAENIAFVYQGREFVNDPATEEFKDAFLRLKQENGLYSEAVDVTFIGDQVFRTTIPLPANVPVGLFRAQVRVFADGGLIGAATENLRITRSGSDRLLFNLSRTQPILYGLGTVMLAILIGWLGGVIFRRD